MAKEAYAKTTHSTENSFHREHILSHRPALLHRDEGRDDADNTARPCHWEVVLGDAQMSKETYLCGKKALMRIACLRHA